MAKETKMRNKIAPMEVEETIKLHGYFGWEPMGQPQRIYVLDGYVIDFFTIFLQRDKAMPNYAGLCDLEEKYYAIPHVPEKPTEPTKPIEPERPDIRILVLLIVICVLFCATGFVVKETSLISIGILLGIIPLSISLLKTKELWGYLKNHALWKKDHALWEKNYTLWKTEYANWKEKYDEYNKFMEMRQEIIKRAKELLQ